MYELIPVTPHCYYIQSPAKIGLVELGQGEVCLIDSGNDKDAGRRVRKVLDGNGWKLRARPAAPSTPPAWTAPSPVTLSWSPPTCTVASRPRHCGTNS